MDKIRLEERESLAHIFSGWVGPLSNKGSYVVSVQGRGHSALKAQIRIILTSDYPQQGPPSFEISAGWLQGQERKDLYRNLSKIAEEKIGDPCVFDIVTEVLRFIDDREGNENNRLNIRGKKRGKSSRSSSTSDSDDSVSSGASCPEIVTSGTIKDRKSVFQGHAAAITSEVEAMAVLKQLKTNKKIADATHNSMAYRIQGRTGLVQDSNDDGEAAAGGRLMHLLEKMNATNVVVVVTRWKGGIQLGPDRFKHLNDAASNALNEGGFIPRKTNNTNEKNKKRGGKKNK